MRRTWNVTVNESGQFVPFHRGLRIGEPQADRQAAMEIIFKAQRAEVNANRRAKHDALTGLGLVRVRGALGGVYYE